MAWPARTLSVAFFAPRVAGDERAGAVAQLDDAFVLELAVGLGDGVRVDHELLRQRPDAGQLLARPQRAGLDGVLHLLHQLEVDGHAGRGIGPEQHGSNCTTELIQCYCRRSSRDLSSGKKRSRGSRRGACAKRDRAEMPQVQGRDVRLQTLGGHHHDGIDEAHLQRGVFADQRAARRKVVVSAPVDDEGAAARSASQSRWRALPSRVKTR